jgi:hypothetical protein
VLISVNPPNDLVAYDLVAYDPAADDGHGWRKRFENSMNGKPS